MPGVSITQCVRERPLIRFLRGFLPRKRICRPLGDRNRLTHDRLWPTGGFTYTTSAEYVAAIDGLERRRQSPQTVVMRDAQTMLTVMFRDKNQTITKSMSFLCAPDTVDPRGAKGK